MTIVAIALQVLWYVLPGFEIDFLTEDELIILQYGAYGSIVDLPEWSYWAFLVTTLLVLVLTFALGRKMRHILLGFFLLSILVFVPTGGMVIETGLSMLLRDLGNLAIGAVITMAYLER
ncbi:MAG: hypothetical protein QNJ14_06720 [Woeseiaceae bacterium]|nr:hypothetical protein [Woeseiaceae bacterium]